ncbi:flagellar M-ring protein FliF [Hungatella sp. L12]|uniref:Flagellar M-ring protein FliF n=1 Tax=Hungatella hominis TaxID=2763050 RepID=A0ABR7HD53_9FIRM|nr:flagellar basal-body MS-ring/collar protein FliF [Hungatella hominis]MBC5711098.1 flagellar M-ring protein FliF [Hungatella hominis]
MGMKEKVKTAVDGNDTIGRLLGSKKKKAAAAGILAAVIIALAAAILLNTNKDGEYVVLFPGISREENNEILAVLNGRGVGAKRNAEGEVTVPENQVGDIMLDMSELGYPKTALPFDIFSDNMGFTTTEFEKRQYLLLNLQDRIERTLKDMNGIKNAIVTLNVSDDSNYVWDDQGADSTGAVSLTLMPSCELSPEKVGAIKNLIANSVPRLLPENVTVVNAETMQEMVSDDVGGLTSYGLGRLDFEAKVEKRLQDKIMNVLTLAYSPGQIRVSATVVIDYDKMITEDLQYEPQDNGQGVVDHYKSGQSVNGQGGGAGGVAGEENNTDIPTYGAAGTGGANGADGDYYRDVDYLVGYIKKQIEKDNVKLQKATVAITVNDNNLTESKKQQLIDAASKAANIAQEDIVVSSFQQIASEKTSEPEKPVIPVTAPGVGGIDPRVLVAGAAAGVFLFLVLLFLILRHRRKKQRKEDQELFGPFEGDAFDLDSDIAERAEERTVENQIADVPVKPQDPVNQVRSFAEDNPEIIASMISTWLKEEKK